MRVQSSESRVQSYRDLLVWQRARLLVRAIYLLTEKFPAKESYRLVDQLCRAAISVPSNVAEGSSRRSTPEFIRFCNIAYSSLAEIETQCYLASDLGYISENELSGVLAQTCEVGKMLDGLIASLSAKRTTKEITELRTLDSEL